MDIEVAAEPVDLNAPPPVEQDDSLAAHEAAFGEKKAPTPDPETPVEPERAPRHRAQSQRATPNDVADIAAFTKRLREAEEAIQIDRKDGESDRVYQLRRRAEIAELAKTYKMQPPAPKAEPVAAVTPPRGAVTPPPPATAKPTWAQFEEGIGTKYQTWAEAQDAYADARDVWREAEFVRQRATADNAAAQKAANERDQQAIDAHVKRMASASQSMPDFEAVTAPILNRQLPTPLLKAIVTADNSPQLVYSLAKDPDLLDDLVIASHGKSIDDDELVATLQRRLVKRAQAGTTGSAASVPPIRTTPRPPNPVRTGPIASGDELPGDESSLADHEKAFGPRRRRR